METEIVRDIKTLKEMQKLGFVTFCKETGTKIKGLYSNETFICCYIDSAETFEYKGKKYTEKYFSGCFYPYLVELTE